MDFWNFLTYVNYLHQEHIELKQKYVSLLSLVGQELPIIKARMEALEQQNLKIVERKTNHPETRTSCQYCGQSFDEHWKLESHLVEHEEAEQYPCNICNKSFQTSWRLGKHLENHDRKNVKVCKYFKKGHFCPFSLCNYGWMTPAGEAEKSWWNFTPKCNALSLLLNYPLIMTIVVFFHPLSTTGRVFFMTLKDSKLNQLKTIGKLSKKTCSATGRSKP